MIGYIVGKVIFSDGTETIIATQSGVGYQIYYSNILPEGMFTGFYISHVIKEADQALYGFHDLRSKKLFELLMTVKGIGPKGSYSLVSRVAASEIIQAIQFDNKKVLTSVPGVGPKAAAQIMLDLQNKITKILMYSDRKFGIHHLEDHSNISENFSEKLFDDLGSSTTRINKSQILDEAVMACKELGFKEEKIISIASKILNTNEIVKAEQLVHLVLKEI